jgi:hypothetical protein
MVDYYCYIHIYLSIFNPKTFLFPATEKAPNKSSLYKHIYTIFVLLLRLFKTVPTLLMFYDILSLYFIVYVMYSENLYILSPWPSMAGNKNLFNNKKTGNIERCSLP